MKNAFHVVILYLSVQMIVTFFVIRALNFKYSGSKKNRTSRVTICELNDDG